MSNNDKPRTYDEETALHLRMVDYAIERGMVRDVRGGHKHE